VEDLGTKNLRPLSHPDLRQGPFSFLSLCQISAYTTRDSEPIECSLRVEGINRYRTPEMTIRSSKRAQPQNPTDTLAEGNLRRETF
jgi:hypothetical protein